MAVIEGEGEAAKSTPHTPCLSRRAGAQPAGTLGVRKSSRGAAEGAAGPSGPAVPLFSLVLQLR